MPHHTPGTPAVRRRRHARLSLIDRSGPIGLSVAVNLFWTARSIRRRLRRYLPLLHASSASLGMSPALASAPVRLFPEPCSTRSRAQPITFIVGPPMPARRGQRARTALAGASHEVASLRVPSAFAGRAVPSGGRQPHRGPSRSDVPPASCTQASAGTSLRFFAPRVSRPASLRVFSERHRPRRPFVRRLLSPTYRAREPGLLSRPGRASLAPGDALGIHLSSLRSFHPTRGRSHASSASPCPPAVSLLRPPRVSSSRGRANQDAGPWASQPRLLGFALAPSSQPYRATRQPRHGFYAQGRKRIHRPGLPWDSLSPLRSSAFDLRFPLLETIPPGLTVRCPRHRCSDGRRGDSGRALRRCRGPRRLASANGVSAHAGLPV
jgi:hypothetical protein